MTIFDFDEQDDDADFAFTNGEYNNEINVSDYMPCQTETDEASKEFFKALNGDYSEDNDNFASNY